MTELFRIAMPMRLSRLSGVIDLILDDIHDETAATDVTVRHRDGRLIFETADTDQEATDGNG